MSVNVRYNHFDGLVQERRNSIANALELRLSCTNPSICDRAFYRILMDEMHCNINKGENLETVRRLSFSNRAVGVEFKTLEKYIQIYFIGNT